MIRRARERDLKKKNKERRTKKIKKKRNSYITPISKLRFRMGFSIQALTNSSIMQVNFTQGQEDMKDMEVEAILPQGNR